MRSVFLEGLGDELEVVDDVDVLGALGLTLSALQTLAGLTMVIGKQTVVKFAVTTLIGELLQIVVKVKILGDGNLLGATLAAIMTGSARNGDGVADDLGRLGDDALLLVVEGHKILHVRHVILQLLHVAHATQDHVNIR